MGYSHSQQQSQVSATLSAADARYPEVRRVTLVGSAVDLSLGVAKIIVGIIGSSQALVADGIHSLSDLVTDFMVLYAAKHASKEADAEHPYGHGRFETVMTVVLGVSLILVAAGIALDAVRRLFSPELLAHPGMLALVIAVISIISKEAIYHYTMAVARKLRSNLLKANAWHSRSDAISSVIVVVGILGTMAGLEYLDAIAAVGVALMIAKIGWQLAWSSIRELVDEALEPEKVQEIEAIINSVDGVQALHMLRTRRMGGDALVDVHIQVPPHVSVSEGHQISEAVRHKLIKKIDEVNDVMVHIDPEDDEYATPCGKLPLRQDARAELRRLWGDVPGLGELDDMVLHYLDGRIDIELTLPLARFDDARARHDMAERLQTVLDDSSIFGKVQVKYQ
jgi:cation diffusion facilitator family transporter